MTKREPRGSPAKVGAPRPALLHPPPPPPPRDLPAPTSLFPPGRVGGKAHPKGAAHLRRPAPRSRSPPPGSGRLPFPQPPRCPPSRSREPRRPRPLCSRMPAAAHLAPGDRPSRPCCPVRPVRAVLRYAVPSCPVPCRPSRRAARSALGTAGAPAAPAAGTATGRGAEAGEGGAAKSRGKPARRRPTEPPGSGPAAPQQGGLAGPGPSRPAAPRVRARSRSRSRRCGSAWGVRPARRAVPGTGLRDTGWLRTTSLVARASTANILVTQLLIAHHIPWWAMCSGLNQPSLL